MPFEVPNHTQTPNSFFDESLKQIKSLCELKVMLVVIRKTFGWQKRRELISLTQLEDCTGLTRQGVQKGIKLAVQHGFIQREAVGQGFNYSLVLGNNSYPAKVLPSPARQNNCLELGNRLDHQLGNNSYPQKKEEKEKKESVFPPPFSSDRFLSAWADFEQLRKEKRNPVKPTQREKLYKKMIGWGEERSVAALEETVEHGWTGVFEPKQNGFQRQAEMNRGGKGNPVVF